MTDLTALHYTNEHEWIRIDDDIATIGITDYAADQLGDVVYVDLPAQGGTVTSGQVMGEIESTKSVSELYAPVDGVVVEVNGEVDVNPGLVNESPFDAGWLVKVRLSGTAADLLDRAAYVELTGGEE